MILGHGLWFLFPVFLIGKLFWIVLLVMLVGFLIRKFAFRNRWRAAYYQGRHWGPPYGGRPWGQPGQPSALEILQMRYARGEIDATTYDQMRERLEASARPKE